MTGCLVSGLSTLSNQTCTVWEILPTVVYILQTFHCFLPEAWHLHMFNSVTAAAQRLRTWACPAAGVAGLTGPVGHVVVESLRTRRKASAFLPHVDESWSAAQAAVFPAPGALPTTGITLFTHPRACVSIVTAAIDGERVMIDYIQLNEMRLEVCLFSKEIPLHCHQVTSAQ